MTETAGERFDGRFDVAVVGLGAMGSAVAYQLTRGGARVVGLDRFEPPHAFGSSHGQTRITRQAVGEGRDYVPFVLAAHQVWRELEAATGESLLAACGALVIASGGAGESHHGRPQFLAGSIDAAQEFGIPHEVLGGAEVARRFPRFLTGPADRAYYEPGGGYLRPERCIAAQLRQASTLGAEIRTGVEVLGIEQEGGGVALRTPTGTVRADAAVVAAGAWTGPLLGAPFEALLTVNRQVLHWFAVDDAPDDAPDHAPGSGEDGPVFIWMHGAGDVDYFYGFPPLPGEGCLKVATEQYAQPTGADGFDRTVTAEESAQMHGRHVAGRLAGVGSRAVRAEACLYTVTPDHGFVIDRHPELDRVVVVSACSGHGFKHSAGVGVAVAELVGQGRSEIDLAPFTLSRLR